MIGVLRDLLNSDIFENSYKVVPSRCGFDVYLSSSGVLEELYFNVRGNGDSYTVSSVSRGICNNICVLNSEVDVLCVLLTKVYKTFEFCYDIKNSVLIRGLIIDNKLDEAIKLIKNDCGEENISFKGNENFKVNLVYVDDLYTIEVISSDFNISILKGVGKTRAYGVLYNYGMLLKRYKDVMAMIIDKMELDESVMEKYIKYYF